MSTRHPNKAVHDAVVRVFHEASTGCVDQAGLMGTPASIIPIHSWGLSLFSAAESLIAYLCRLMHRYD